MAKNNGSLIMVHIFLTYSEVELTKIQISVTIRLTIKISKLHEK